MEQTTEQLIKNWKTAQKRLNSAEGRLRYHFNKIYAPQIAAVQTEDGARLMLDELGKLPEYKGKINLMQLLFARIIEIKGDVGMFYQNVNYGK